MEAAALKCITVANALQHNKVSDKLTTETNCGGFCSTHSLPVPCTHTHLHLKLSINHVVCGDLLLCDFVAQYFPWSQLKILQKPVRLFWAPLQGFHGGHNEG